MGRWAGGWGHKEAALRWVVLQYLKTCDRRDSNLAVGSTGTNYLPGREHVSVSVCLLSFWPKLLIYPVNAADVIAERYGFNER